jgi:hypothetical protein
LRAEHVPLFDGGKLYVQDMQFQTFGEFGKANRAVRMETWGCNVWPLDTYYTCDTAAVLPDGTPPPTTGTKREREPASEAEQAQALADATLCHTALNELGRIHDDKVVTFHPNGTIKQVHCSWSSDDGVKAAESFPDDPNAAHIKVPTALFKGIFPEAPETLVTIGDGRALCEGTLEPFLVLQPVDELGPHLFGPDDAHFGKGTVLSCEMRDEHVDDDEEFTWSGSGRCLVKITPALVEWSRTKIATVELLGSAAHRAALQTFAARLDMIALPDAVKAWQKKNGEISQKQRDLSERSIAWNELQLKSAPISHKIAMAFAEAGLKRAKVLEEWDAARARMLAPKATATAAANPKRRKP